MAVQKTGRGFKALCPFHEEKTPSLSIDSKKGVYHCFGCGQSGDHLSFLQGHLKMVFAEAVSCLRQTPGAVAAVPKTLKEEEKQPPFPYELVARVATPPKCHQGGRRAARGVNRRPSGSPGLPLGLRSVFLLKTVANSTEQVSGAMLDGQNDDLVVLHSIDDTISTYQALPIGQAQLRNHGELIRKVAQGGRCVTQPLKKATGVVRGVLADALADGRGATRLRSILNPLIDLSQNLVVADPLAPLHRSFAGIDFTA